MIRKNCSCNHHLYTRYAYFFMPLNEIIANSEKTDGICLFTFVADDFTEIIFTSINLFY